MSSKTISVIRSKRSASFARGVGSIIDLRPAARPALTDVTRGRPSASPSKQAWALTAAHLSSAMGTGRTDATVMAQGKSRRSS